jgi:hypothetical protein
MLNAELVHEQFTTQIVYVTVPPDACAVGLATFCRARQGFWMFRIAVAQYETANPAPDADAYVAHATFVTSVPSAVAADASLPIVASSPRAASQVCNHLFMTEPP